MSLCVCASVFVGSLKNHFSGRAEIRELPGGMNKPHFERQKSQKASQDFAGKLAASYNFPFGFVWFDFIQVGTEYCISINENLVW